jgi:haloalkane dehalogenase
VSLTNAVHSRDGFADEYPFESHWLDLDGVRMHYVDEGPRDGRVVLCVHGNPTWSFIWRHLIRELSPQRRVIAPDHIGCGFSDKPQQYPYRLAQHVANLRRLIESLDLRDVTLVGHDWGGCIGLGAATELPERFARFVLMNTGAFRSRQIPLRIAICRIPFLGPLALRGFNAFSRAALTMAVARRPLSAAARRGLLAPYDSWANRVAVSSFVQDIPLRPSHPSYAKLAEIESGLSKLRDRPMLLLWGARDWCFTLDFHREFQRRFPNAESHVIADAGHYVFEDAPDDVLTAIRDFLCRTV